MSVVKKIFLSCLTVAAALQALSAQPLDIRNKFSTYRTSALQEKVYIHTDRDTYLTGETLQLSAYVVDGSFFPSSGAVNPALTIIANALRVGDHLLQRLN